MEQFTYNGDFYSELTELCDYEGWEEQEIETYPDDFTIEVVECELKPMLVFSIDWIFDRIDDGIFSEYEYDNESMELIKIFRKHIDFDKINSEIPKMYYETRTKHVFTKQDLLDAAS